MGRKIKTGSRVSRRVMTKSPIRLNCQRKTRGAANRAAKTLAGKRRGCDPNCTQHLMAER